MGNEEEISFEVKNRTLNNVEKFSGTPKSSKDNVQNTVPLKYLIHST